MFELTAPYYDKFYSFLDYKSASSTLQSLIRKYHSEALTLLDVACGTGRYLEHLQPHFAVSGLDILPELLEQASVRCPGISLHQLDMRDFSLDEKFDVITCLFCSIGYMQDKEDLEKAISCMAKHLNTGGVLIFEPWICPENCWTNHVTCDVHDEPELKVVRMHTHEREGNKSVYEMHTLVGMPEGVKHFVETEKMGLFTQDEYKFLIEKAGLSASYIDIALFPKHKYGIWIGQK